MNKNVSPTSKQLGKAKLTRSACKGGKDTAPAARDRWTRAIQSTSVEPTRPRATIGAAVDAVIARRTK